jgi:hypothetical protein
MVIIDDAGASKTKRWTPEQLAAQIEPVFTFLRGGLDALEQPPERRR